MGEMEEMLLSGEQRLVKMWNKEQITTCVTLRNQESTFMLKRFYKWNSIWRLIFHLLRIILFTNFRVFLGSSTTFLSSAMKKTFLFWCRLFLAVKVVACISCGASGKRARVAIYHNCITFSLRLQIYVDLHIFDTHLGGRCCSRQERVESRAGSDAEPYTNINK